MKGTVDKPIDPHRKCKSCGGELVFKSAGLGVRSFGCPKCGATTSSISL
jgi:predicted RNA-binding Zn-ribbon protein involved in translation (DUF1610 family)